MSSLILAAAAAADLILVGGRIHTMHAARPEATALAVRGGRIVAVGTDAEIRALPPTLFINPRRLMLGAKLRF